VAFFDNFEYAVDRDAGTKFAPGGPFVAHGWNGGKDGATRTGAGGWLYTATSIPGVAEPFPGVGSSRALVVEAKVATDGFDVDGIDGGWRQTDFYLRYGETETGSLDTVPPDVWFQHWLYIADTVAQPSLMPPTSRWGKWIYPTRNGYPSTNLSWLFNFTGVLLDSEVNSGGSSEEVDIGQKSLAVTFNLTDTDANIYTDARAYALGSLGHSGSSATRRTGIGPNQWWLMRFHIDHTMSPGIVETWIRPRGGAWVKIVDTLTSATVQWLPTNTTEGHRGFVIPSTVNNWYQDPTQATTHGDWWIYLDDFAMARGVHSGGNGVGDLPSYP
jgi:hypothetical protein